jgi:hypothetical protein
VGESNGLGKMWTRRGFSVSCHVSSGHLDPPLHWAGGLRWIGRCRNAQAERALQRAYWDADIDAMKVVLEAHRVLGQPNDGDGGGQRADVAQPRVVAAWQRLHTRIAELQQAESEELAALASTQELEEALLSDDVAEMLEVLADHRGFDHPRVAAAWEALQQRVELEQQRAAAAAAAQTKRRRDEEAAIERTESLKRREREREVDEVASTALRGLREALQSTDLQLMLTTLAQAEGGESAVLCEAHRVDSVRVHGIICACVGCARVAHPHTVHAAVVGRLDKEQSKRVVELRPLLEKLRKRILVVQQQRKAAEARREERRRLRLLKVAQLRKEAMLRTPVPQHKAALPPDLQRRGDMRADGGLPRVGTQPGPASNSGGSPGADGATPRGVGGEDSDAQFYARFETKGVLGQGGFGEVSYHAPHPLHPLVERVGLAAWRRVVGVGCTVWSLTSGRCRRCCPAGTCRSAGTWPSRWSVPRGCANLAHIRVRGEIMGSITVRPD